MNEDRLLAVVGEIYDAATDPVLLREIGHRISRQLDSASALVFTATRPSAELVELVSASDNFDANARARYREYYSFRNEWFLRGAQREPPFVARGGDLIAYGEFDRTEFCADWCSQVGIYHLLAATFPIEGDLIGAIGIHRPRSKDAFNDEDEVYMSRLAPHLMRAVQIAHRFGTLRSRTELTLEILHDLGVGLVLLDGRSRPLFANAVAERVIRGGRWLTVSGGLLRTVNRSWTDRFERAVAQAAETGTGESLASGSALRIPDRFTETLAVLVAPFRRPGLAVGGAVPATAIVFADPDGEIDPPSAAIAEAFGLTPAEGRLVARLSRGRSLVGCARELSISINTAKAQLRSVFQKTGHTRQADLIAAVLASPVLKLQSERPSGRAFGRG